MTALHIDEITDTEPLSRPALAAHRFEERAARLRQEATVLHPALAHAWQRRASELELQAMLLAVRSGAVPADVRPSPGDPRVFVSSFADACC
jgi:hypothetical protein